jgi:1-acyl-sn-glycerol-3-phosphate acyltransferase
MILYSAVEAWARPLITHAYKVVLVDADRVPETGGCILASNHESILDGFFLALVTRRQVHYMVKAELYRYPVLKQLLDALGCFPVRRDESDAQAVGRGVRLLEQGAVLGMFPQGTCLPYRVRPFKRGAARLALQTGVPLVPVCMVGNERAIQPRTHRIGFPRVTILVGEPIAVERGEPTKEGAAELTARVERAVAALRRPYGEPDHAWYDDASEP